MKKDAKEREGVQYFGDRNDGKKGDQGTIDKITAFLGADSIDKAFGQGDVVNAIKMLILSDPDVMQMLFRFRTPSAKQAVARAVLYRQYEDNGYLGGLKQLFLLMGFGSNIDDRRINALVEAITAERKERQASPADRIKQFIDGIGGSQ